LLLLFTQGQGLGGIDQARPWGAALSITADGSQFPAMAFLPVGDFDKLLETLATVIADPVDAGDDIFEIRRDPNTYFLKHHGEWVYVAQQKSALADLPDDPLKQLRGLDEEYDLGVSVNVQNIPQALRDMASDLLMQAMETQLAQQMDADDDETDEDDEDDEDAQALRLKLARDKAEDFVKSINELDQVTVGLNIDRAESRTFLDVEITAVPGSETAQSFAEGAVESQGSLLAGALTPGSMLSLHANLPLTKDDRAQFKTMLERLREHWLEEIDDEDEVADKELTKQLAGKAIDVLVQTIDKDGRINAGLIVVPAQQADDEAEGAQLTAALGAVVASGAKLEEVAKQFIALAEYGEADLNVEKYQGHRFHVLTLPVPENENLEQAKEMFGDPLKVVLAFGDQTCFVALGEKGAATIKQVIDGSRKTPEEKLPPVTVALGMAPLLKLAAAQKSNVAAEKMAAGLAASGKDRVKFTATPVDNGLRLRLEGEEGVNKLLGSLLGNAAQMGGR
ncbi:MAG TPA: hypothetical protein VF278_15835, partial [Pirellulales bacterium]